MIESAVGAVLGLIVLALLVVVMGRIDSVCSGDCKQGRECDCGGKK